jgi:hypothetical protein
MAAHHQPIAVVLDFVQPKFTGGRLRRHGRQARLDEAGRWIYVGTVMPSHERAYSGGLWQGNTVATGFNP